MIPIQNSPLSSASTAASGSAAASRRAGSVVGSVANPAVNPAGAAATEQVSISGAGQMLNLASTQGATPPASDARISELQNAIRSGQYVVNPQRIASGLLQDSQALIGATKPASN
ncbi:MAG: flagellar biosynthesis anti-sigma factor FlgM [Thiomonas sp.]|uniref:Negative regulator of flagellin synthesis n=1 Tax=Thiomonas arsenitoxydans (strain DSM 22701 / CIP 110005 / 3As) TaxID=426114 RepID=A0A8I1MX63_THIA3|nr:MULTISPECIES: flagellar biosynthesis anti-sigma factor FlgM [Thiomonas]MBN8745233.1 flagellar biosynthesis anti-sigma factor FlgM [Thiomonas arsenitoxydans]MDE1978698.1 flagellar biosynthesis anti-sigma factor FlgM [Betaproteobacteria bacterium]MDE2270124.1 flagellar biosynthesis anti-sigma factor FlgM [Betaproteobacteria bacterium]ODU96343.1 MAG: flagellar biosynthesis anti-sigma factor FlgM [Thiomonas sp. SCN 64-16]